MYKHNFKAGGKVRCKKLTPDEYINCYPRGYTYKEYIRNRYNPFRNEIFEIHRIYDYNTQENFNIIINIEKNGWYFCYQELVKVDFLKNKIRKLKRLLKK